MPCDPWLDESLGHPGSSYQSHKHDHSQCSPLSSPFILLTLLVHLKNQFFSEIRFYLQPWSITPNHGINKTQIILGVLNWNTTIQNDLPTQSTKCKSWQNVLWRVSYHDRNLKNLQLVSSIRVHNLNLENNITLTYECNRCPIRSSEGRSTRFDFAMSKLFNGGLINHTARSPHRSSPAFKCVLGSNLHISPGEIGNNPAKTMTADSRFSPACLLGLHCDVEEGNHSSTSQHHQEADSSSKMAYIFPFLPPFPFPSGVATKSNQILSQILFDFSPDEPLEKCNASYLNSDLLSCTQCKLQNINPWRQSKNSAD